MDSFLLGAKRALVLSFTKKRKLVNLPQPLILERFPHLSAAKRVNRWQKLTVWYQRLQRYQCVLNAIVLFFRFHKK